MRILFYVEPFPIRNTSTHFVDIARNILALVGDSNSVDIRVYMNRATLAKLGDVAKEKAAHVLPSSDEDEALFASHMLPWTNGGLKAWTRLIAGGDVAEQYAELIHRLWSKYPFDMIVNWGENAAISMVASRVDAVHVSMELGCTRPPFGRTVAFDLFGTNGNSLPAKMNLDTLEKATNGRTMTAAVAQSIFSEDGEARPVEFQFATLPPRLRAALLKPGRKTAFLPLQLYDDANLVVHSPYATLTEVVQDAVPRLVDAGYYPVIKPHPDAQHRPNALVENELARLSLSELEGRFLWCDEPLSPAQNCAIMQATDLVVTVNSSVGFEALYYDKTVVVLGSSSYKVQGVFPDLSEATGDNFDRGTYLHKVALLRAFMLECYLAPWHTWNNATAFLQKLVLLGGIAREANGEPTLVARRLYEALAQGRRFQRSMEALSDASTTTGIFCPPVASSREAPTAVSTPARDIIGVTADAKQKLVAKIRKYSGASIERDAVAWIEQTWADKALLRERLLQLGCIDKVFMAARYDDIIPANANPLTFFIAEGEAQGMSPSPKFDLEAYLNTKAGAAATSTPLKDLLIDLFQKDESVAEPLTGVEAEALRAARETLRGQSSRSKNRIAVVAHLFYADVVPELLNAIGNISEPFDLIATLPTWGDQAIRETVLSRYPAAIIVSLPNRGRDIGSFLEVLPLLIERDYLAVLKVQTKKGYYRSGRLMPHWGDAWRKLAYDSLVLDSASTRRIIDSFERNRLVTMVGPERLYVTVSQYPSRNSNLPFWTTARLPPLSQASAFFAGTMFWVRPLAFKLLLDAGIQMESFEIESGTNDGALAHDLERYFGQLATYHRGLVLMSDPSENGVILKNASPHMHGLNSVIEDFLEQEKIAAEEVSGLLW